MSGGRWAKGQSGNAAGRKPGTGKVAQLRESLGRGLPKIITKLKAQALAGDVQAARLLLERAIPPLKAEEQPVSFELPDGPLADQGRAVIAAVGAGHIAPAQAAQVLAALGNLGRLADSLTLADLLQRMAELERALGIKEGQE